ncbi:MAG: HTTM domain-containing protein [Polyangiaceae bacterium]
MQAHVSGLDPRSLAAFRISLGLTLLGGLWARTHGGRLVAHYTDEGAFPVAAAKDMAFGARWSFLDAFTTSTSATFAFATITLVVLAFTLGLFTRVAHVLVVVILVALYHRNPLVEDGSDTALRLFVVWTAFLPLGDRFSLDVVLRRRRPSGKPVEGLAVWLLLLNLSISYFLNAYQKDGGRWAQGLAIRDVFWDPWIAGPLAPWGRTFGDGAIKALSYGTLVLEYALMGSILCVPLSVAARRFTVIAMLCLHGGIAAFMNLGIFSYLFLSLSLLFIPGEDWDRLPFLFKTRRARRVSLTEHLVTTPLLLVWAYYCAVFLALNPRSAPALKQWANRQRPGLINHLHDAFLIPQGWLKFRAPPRKPGTVVFQVERDDGTIEDALRAGPWDLYRPLKSPHHLGKYWVSWSLYSTFPQYEPYRHTFADYLYRQGVKRFWAHWVWLETPDGAADGPVAMGHDLMFAGERPTEIDLKARAVIRATAPVVPQNMRQYGHRWTGNDHVFFAFRHAGDQAEVVIDVPRSCPARIDVSYTRAKDFGRSRLRLGKAELVLDAYAPEGVEHDETTMVADVEAGRAVILLEALDKPPGSLGHKLALDAIRIGCNDVPAPPAMP